MIRVLVLAAAAAFSATGCFNECGFHERCDGNVYERCGDGPDHIVGRKIRRFPCEAPNPFCIEVNGNEAFCASAPEPRCVPRSPDSCERGVISRCSEGFVVLQDCRREPGTGRCGGEDGRLRCL